MKKPTLKELVIQGFENVNKRLDKIEIQLKEVRSLPTVKKELSLVKKKSKI